MISSDLEGNES